MVGIGRRLRDICFLFLLSSFTTPVHASDWDLWQKWPSLSGLSDLDVYGHWGDSTLTDGASWTDPGAGFYYGVHGALTYDDMADESKLFVMQTQLLVYNLDWPDSAQTLDLNGTPQNPEYPPNGHMPFCSGYVLLDSGNLLIAGGPLWQVYTDSANENGVPTTRGPVSLYVPSKELTYEDGGWAVTDSLPDASGATIPTACADNPLNRNRYYPR